eukprot:m.362338 g.362338  ORF g.362338 m.362338 type:complete len:590 (-) comp20372_c0_seq1:172-1941(-)
MEAKVTRFIEEGSVPGDVTDLVEPDTLDTVVSLVLDKVPSVAVSGSEAQSLTFVYLVAELAKAESARTSLGASKLLIAHLLKTIRDTDNMLLRHQAFRAIGNLCYEHENNRKEFHEGGGVDALQQAFTRMSVAEHPEEDVGKAAFAGAVMNMMNDAKELAEDLVRAGVVSSLVWLVKHAESDIEKALSRNALLHFAEIDSALPELTKDGNAMVLLDLLEACEDEEEDIEMMQVFRKVIAVDETLPFFATEAVLERVRGLTLHARPGVSKVAAITFSVLLADDACLGLCWNDPDKRRDTLALLTSWLSDIERHDMVVAGITGVGNVCRSDANARLLGETPGLLDSIVQLLHVNLSFVQHAALGTLKNMVKLPANATAVANAKGVEALLIAVNDPQGPLQYLACSTLRSLVMTCPAATAPLLVDSADTIRRLIHLTKSETMPVQSESMRLLAALIKVPRSSAIMEPLVAEGVAAVLARMFVAEHPQCQHEATIALAILASTSETCASTIVSAAFVDVLLTRISQCETQQIRVEVLSNYVTILVQLITNAPNLRENQSKLQDIKQIAEQHLTTNPQYVALQTSLAAALQLSS